MPSGSCDSIEEVGLSAYHFDAQAFLFAAHDMDGGEFAALDTLQYGLARDAERARIASRIGKKSSPASPLKRSLRSLVRRIRQGAPGVGCSPAIMPSLSKRWMVDGATPSMTAVFLIVSSSPSGAPGVGSKQGIPQCRRRLPTRPAVKR